MILCPIPYQRGILWVDKNQKGKQGFNYDSESKELRTLNFDVSRDSHFKIIAQSPNLSLPNIPYIEIEEDVNDLAYQYYTSSQYHDIGSGYHWSNGYKAASAKKYTEENLRKALQVLSDSSYIQESSEHYTMDSVRFSKTFDEIIQSLQPKPVSVEIEMRKGCGIIIKPCDCSEMDMDCQYLIDKPITYIKDGKTFLKVKKVNCES